MKRSCRTENRVEKRALTLRGRVALKERLGDVPAPAEGGGASKERRLVDGESAVLDDAL